MQINWIQAEAPTDEHEVDVDEWWKQVDLFMVNGAVAAKTRKPKPVDAHKVAPWIAPVCRSSKVLNTEHLKGTALNKSNYAYIHVQYHTFVLQIQVQ